jgi:hypothetical protein
MFFCKCGGVLLVKDIEHYPSGLKNEEKLSYDRTCNAKCAECGKEYENMKYD